MEPTASINLFSPSHTHTHTPSLSIIRTYLSFASSPEQWPSKFPGSLHWNVTNTVWHEGSPSSSVSESRSQCQRASGPPLCSRTPLNIHARSYKPACERWVSANSRATKRNFCSELKHLSISQLWRTHNKLKRAHTSQINLWASTDNQHKIFPLWFSFISISDIFRV